MEKSGPLYIVDGKVHWCNYCGKYGNSSKTRNRTAVRPRNSTTDNISGKKTHLKRYMDKEDNL